MDRILGIDIGTKTIGVAVSDPLGITSQPITVKEYESKNIEIGISILKELVEKYEPKVVVYGLPLNMDGTKSDTTHYVESFIELAKKRFNLLFEPIDERWTSKEATSIIVKGNFKKSKRKAKNDQIAASLILQTYLNKI